MDGVSFGNEDPNWSPGGGSDNTDFITGGDLAGMAGSRGSLVGDDTDDAPDSSTGSSSGSSSGSSGTAGQRVYRRGFISRTAAYVWKAVSSGPGPDNPSGAGYGAPRGTPNPDIGSEGGETLTTEELNELAKKELKKIGHIAEETGPPPDLSGELGSELDPLINWGDNEDEGDEEFVGSHPDVDITPSDPSDMAGGGESGIEDTGSGEGFEDIDP